MTANWVPFKKYEDLKVLSKEQCYEGYQRVLSYTVQYPTFAGGMSAPVVREIVERPNAVAALLYHVASSSVILIEQCRVSLLSHPETSPWLLEVVAGLIDLGESEVETLQREVQEEAGCVLRHWERIAAYFPTPGTVSEQIALYAAEVVALPTERLHGVVAEAEDICVHVFTVPEALALLEAGQAKNATTLIALQWLALHHTEIFGAKGK